MSNQKFCCFFVYRVTRQKGKIVSVITATKHTEDVTPASHPYLSDQSRTRGISVDGQPGLQFYTLGMVPSQLESTPPWYTVVIEQGTFDDIMENHHPQPYFFKNSVEEKAEELVEENNKLRATIQRLEQLVQVLQAQLVTQVTDTTLEDLQVTNDDDNDDDDDDEI